MYKVIIAEDEMLVRMGLKNSVNWSKYDMEVVADVSDGQQAWDAYCSLSPDILITDINIPIISGMDLISRIREDNQNIEIIIISCIEEFSKVKKAMSLGVSEYILKMIMTEAELEIVLEKTKQNLIRKNPHRISNYLSANNTDFLKEQFLKEFIFYNIRNTSDMETFIKQNDFKICPKNIVLGLIEIDQYSTLETFFEDDKGQLIRTSLLNVLNEIISSYKFGEIFHDDINHYVLITNISSGNGIENANEEMSEIFRNIKKTLYSCFNISTTFSHSIPFDGYDQLGNSYRICKNMILKKFTLGFGIIINNETKISGDCVRNKLTILRKIPDFLKGMSNQNVNQYIEIIKSLEHNCLLSKESAIASFLALFDQNFNYINIINEKPNYTHIKFRTAITQSETLDECICSYLDFVYMIEKQLAENTTREEIVKALTYIQQNYLTGITLQSVAMHVNLSPNYFSHLFKEETNENFIDYVMNLKIEKAKQLLMLSSKKTNEISYMLGFTDDTYFCRFFKVKTGFSPGDFKKKSLREEFSFEKTD